jgi:peptide/nickel transport system ATP-binding protein
MQDLQVSNNLTYVFVTHDMSVVKHISDDILVMYLGCMMEKSPSKEIFRQQLHPYTKGLMSAIPIPDITIKRKTIIMEGELSSPIEPKPGCRFANHCPHAKDKCHTEQPPMTEELPNHFVACHYCREINGM